jgi:hypothetical protein
MSDARWFDIEADVEAAIVHFTQARALFEAGGFTGDDLTAYRSQMALMHSMQCAYSSLEMAFERIMELVAEQKPTGVDYHAALVRRLSHPLPSKRPALLHGALVDAVDEVRRFRHVVRHAYQGFDVVRAAPAVMSGMVVTERIRQALQDFKRAIDPVP